MFSRVTLVIYLFSVSVSMVQGYNILGIFMHTGASHFRFFQPLLNALVENGHTVTTVSYFPGQVKHQNYTDLILYGELLAGSLDMSDLEKLRHSKLAYYIDMLELFEWGRNACDTFYKSDVIDQIFELHKSKSFDLVITEIFNTDCHLGVIHKLNIPYIGMSSCVILPWHYDRFGLPDTPSHVPSHMLPLSEQMDYPSRILNWFVARTMKSAYRVMEFYDNEIIAKRFGAGVPDVRELSKQISVMFVNQHYSFSGARPLPPSFIEVGGLHMKDDVKPLPKNWADIVNNAKDGVVLISWGSMIRAATLPIRVRQAIVRAVAKFPQTFIWKWEEDNLEDQPKNLHTSKWLPQKDILCHPNVKAFISHGGLMGTTEAIYCGVPIIVTPIFGDQPNNAAALVHRNIAVLLEYEDITEDTMTDAIAKVLSPELYQNAKTISYSYNNRLVKPMDTALWWVNHVIKTNGHPLGKSHSMEMSWFTYYSVDVILAVSSVTLICVLLLFKCFICCLRRCSKKSDQLKKQKIK